MHHNKIIWNFDCYKVLMEIHFYLNEAFGMKCNFFNATISLEPVNCNKRQKRISSHNLFCIATVLVIATEVNY